MKKIIFYISILLFPLPVLAYGLGDRFFGWQRVLYEISLLAAIISALLGLIGLILYIKRRSILTNLPLFVRIIVFSNMALGVILLMWLVTIVYWKI